MVFGCFSSGRSRKRWKPVIVRSPSPQCRCSCHRYEHYGNRTENHDPLGVTPFPSHSYTSQLSPKPSLIETPIERTINNPLRESPQNPIVMDLTYVTERIIVMTFPETGTNAAYRNNLKDVVQMLRTKHKSKYMVFNLSEKRHDLRKLNPNICEFGWHNNLAPPLERLCSVCKAVDSWLSCDIQHVAVIHSKGDSGRTGVIISAFMHYTDICASADQALDRFAMKRFYDDKLAVFMNPSQKRYVHYFAGLLSGAIRMNNNPLYLRHIIVHGIPNYDQRGGCRPFVKIYQGMQLIHTTGVYLASQNRARRMSIVLNPSIQLRGDILIKCYHKKQSPAGRSIIFRLQFHTCTLENDRLVFSKDDLDDALKDSRFPNDGIVEFLFASSPSNRENLPQNGISSDGMTPLSDDSPHDPIVKWDSYENFDLTPQDKPDPSLDAFAAQLNNPQHTQGPIDGSLYATVSKSGKKFPVTFSLPITGPSGDSNSDDGPHTISIDSGISSTASAAHHPHHGAVHSHHSHTNGTSSGFPSPINVEVEVHHHHESHARNGPTPEEQAQLDELLSGMLQQVESLPDYSTLTKRSTSVTKSASSPLVGPKYSPFRQTSDSMASKKSFDYSYTRSGIYNGGGLMRSGSEVSTPRFLTRPLNFSSTDDRHKPYHAQSGSQPFSYGVTANSPALQRRRLYSESTAYVTESQTPGESEIRDVDNDVFSDYASSTYQDMCSDEGTPLTWLQRQQLKLKSKREGKGQKERQWKEQRLMEELRSVAKRIPTDESSRESSPPYSQPLHINTSTVSGIRGPTSPILPERTSSRTVDINTYPSQTEWHHNGRALERQRSDTSYDRERPFVAVKRAHAVAKMEMANTGTTPQQLAAASPLYGTVYPYNQHRVYMPNTRTDEKDLKSGLLMKTPHVDEVDFITPTKGRVHYSMPAKHNISADVSWTPSAVSSSPQGSPDQSDRPSTPGFPITPRTPYVSQIEHSPAKSPTFARKGAYSPTTREAFGESRIITNGQSSPTGSVYYGQSDRSSMLSLNESEVISQHPLFVKDTSHFWYKSTISREEAINMLRDKPPGTFVVRDSNSFPGAFGLALKVATPPPNVQSKSGDISNELVRHFLIEPTTKGVRMKGCPNEPVFGSLSALVYQHSVMPIALPCKLIIPESDPSGETVDSIISNVMDSSGGGILSQGAACNVLYLITVDMESLTGPHAVRKAINELFALNPPPIPTVVHFKVASKGITLTDNHHRLFFRRHYPLNAISHCGVDPDGRRWTNRVESIHMPTGECYCFGFVARKTASKTDNQCHVFAEFEHEQPASAIVSFVNKVLASVPNQQK